MNNSQLILNLCKNLVIYCPICQLKFNKTNPFDIKFHNKLHKSKLIENKKLPIKKWKLIGSKDRNELYQSGNDFYLKIKTEVIVECSGLISNDRILIKKMCFYRCGNTDEMMPNSLVNSSFAHDNLAHGTQLYKAMLHEALLNLFEKITFNLK